MANVVISGDTSGAITLAAPAVAGTNTITLPASTGTMVVTGGAQTVQFAAGSAAAPSITFTGDTNTGIFSPAADTIAFSEGGVESMRIDSSGNVGIGLSSPTSRLTVRTPDGDGVSIQNAAGTAYRWAVNADNSFSCVNTGVAERMRIDSGGRVTTPSQPCCFAKYSFSGTVSGTYLWDIVPVNVGSCYNASTGRFTAPVAGIYQVSYTVPRLGTVNSGCVVDNRLLLNGGQIGGMADVFGTGTNSSTTWTGFVSMAANDWVAVTTAGFGTFLVGFTDFTVFSVRLVQ